jgi:hypothetical protein
MLGARQTADEFATMQGKRKIEEGQHLEQQLPQHFDVLGAIVEYLLAFFGGERPSLHNAFAHRVLAFWRDAAQSEILQSSN